MKVDTKRVAFMGGKKVGFHCLKFLIENSESLNIDLVGVFENNSKLSSKTESVGLLARDYSISVSHNQDDLLDVENLDFIISVQYNEILKQIHIDKARSLAINLHMAPLPEYRGCNQFSFAIIDGVKQFGTSLHRLESSIDGGDLIAERRFDLPQHWFVKELYEKTLRESIALFENNIRDVIHGNYSLIPQKKLAESRIAGFHLRKEVENIKSIDNSWDVEKQKRFFRATWFPPFSPPIEKQSGKELDLNWYNSIG